MRRKVFPILLVMLLVASITACGTTWKSKAVKGYQFTGAVLTQIHNSGNELCNQGVLSPDKCAQVKKIYNDTRLAYIAAGDALIAAVETEDVIVQKKFWQEYLRLTNIYNDLAIKLIQLAFDLGILK